MVLYASLPSQPPAVTANREFWSIAGWKASIVLEELDLSYNVKSIDMSKNEQKEPWYIKINPNGR